MMILNAIKADGQVINDDCSTAIEIDNVSNWCSQNSAFTNLNAMPGTVPPASCFTASQRDVWYKFTAVSPNITITINKHSTNLRPQAALYSGTCSNLVEIGCADHLASNDVTQVFSDNLVIGQTYYLRVQGRSNTHNAFDMCFISAFPPKAGGADCVKSSVLCNKNPFIHQQFTDEGDIPDELSDALCVQDPLIILPSETHSAWYKWTCSTSGTLTFTITPLKEDDDIDFVIWEIDGDISSCVRPNILRCEGANCDFPETGLSEGSTAVFDPPNCDLGQTQFLAPLDMEAGKSYVLVVHNFTGSNNGFYIEFGGTGEFLGPTARFNAAPNAELCVNKPISIQDLTDYLAVPISAVKWDFGEGAVPATANTQGDKTVTYSTPGVKHILLTVTSETGCLDYYALDIEIGEDCCPTDATITTNNNITVDKGTVVNLNVQTTLTGGTITYQWHATDPIACPTCQNTTLTANSNQWVHITVSNEDGCSLSDSFLIFVRNDTTIIDTTDMDTSVIDTNIKEPIVRKIFIPNAFSPNNDGINDGFTVYGDASLDRVEYMRIYNRWGACIFSATEFAPNNERFGWKGTFKERVVDPGVYVYLIGLRFRDGTTDIYKGSITIIK